MSNKNESATTTKKVTVSSQIRKLHAEGKSTGEIAKALGKRYQHVHNVLNQDKVRLQLEELKAIKAKK